MYMKASVNKSLLYTFILIFLFYFQAYAENINELDLQLFLSDVEKSFMDKDIKGIEDSLAETIVINVIYKVGNRIEYSTYTKESYLLAFSEQWKAMSNYEYQKIASNFQIQGNKAIVTKRVKESMRYNSRKMSWLNEEEIVVELIENKLQATEITINSSYLN